MGDESFLEKFQRQLQSTSASVKQLAAELLWLLFLFPVNITGSKKRRNIMEVWSWSGMILDPAHAMLRLLDNGVGSSGQAFNNRRDIELAFAIRMALWWKETGQAVRDQMTNNPWTLGTALDETVGGEKRQFRHMILFLLFPDSYERISSSRQKQEIVAALESLPGLQQELLPLGEGGSAAVTLDKKLLAIRRVLEKQYPGQEIDFYKPPVETMWQPAEPPDDSDTEEETDVTPDTGKRIWVEMGYLLDSGNPKM
jgi:5-methylcytosine-specific restriction protein B